MAQQPHIPNVEAQRAAMKKLEFLIGKWAGEARVLRGPGEPVLLVQTEEAQYKLDGLVLLIEGVGRPKADAQAAALQALGIISYDDESGMYRMRAFNDGRFLETEIKLADNGKGIRWGFDAGEIRTSSVHHRERRLDRTHRNHNRRPTANEVHGTHGQPPEVGFIVLVLDEK